MQRWQYNLSLIMQFRVFNVNDLMDCWRSTTIHSWEYNAELFCEHDCSYLCKTRKVASYILLWKFILFFQSLTSSKSDEFAFFISFGLFSFLKTSKRAKMTPYIDAWILVAEKWLMHCYDLQTIRIVLDMSTEAIFLYF